MGLLEDLLSDTFEAQVAVAPAIHDAAGRAIRLGRRARRRRTVRGTVAAVLGLTLVTMGIRTVLAAPGVAGLGGTATSRVVTASATMPVDLLSGDRLIVAPGPTISLAGLPTANAAWRVDGGWLVRTLDPTLLTSDLWFVSEDGARSKIAEGDRVAVGKGDSSQVRVAWGGNGLITVASLRAGQLTGSLRTTGTGQLSPIGIAGGGVLLGRSPTSSATTLYDMWFPDQGAYLPGPQFAHKIVGVTGDGGNLFGLLGQDSTCLAVISPRGFVATTRQRCDLDIGANDVVSSSPDGRWLATLSAHAVAVYRFDTVWTAPVPVADWPIAATDITWLRDGSIAVIDNSRVVRLAIGNPDREDSSPAGREVGQPLLVVPDLRG